jgi:metal-responsive CopG/Arc/MetJ family transcriptional regulator
MPRKKIWLERIHVTLREGTKDRIDAVLGRGEDRLDLIREGIEAAITKRERAERRQETSIHEA